MDCPICSWTPDNADYLLLSESKYWRICLAPNQSLIGRSVIHLKRHTGDLANLSEDELLEFLDVVKRVEASTRLAFGATMFNWSCYMNHSYRENPPNPHVHWWAVPRYERQVEFCDLTFEDPQFGSPYDHDRWFEPGGYLKIAIADKLSTNLHSSRNIS